MNLEDIMLGSVSQSPKDKDCVIPLCDVPSHIQRQKVGCGCQGRQGRQGEEMGSHSYRVAVVQDEEFCGWTAVGVAKHCEFT